MGNVAYPEDYDEKTDPMVQRSKEAYEKRMRKISIFTSLFGGKEEAIKVLEDLKSILDKDDPLNDLIRKIKQL
jgi:hypothetical protein